MYIGEEQSEEPDFQYIPDTQQISSNLPQGSDPLAGSLMLLQDSIDSGAALAQFEVFHHLLLYTLGCSHAGDVLGCHALNEYVYSD